MKFIAACLLLFNLANPALAAEMDIFEAAREGDLPALTLALDRGVSTEATNERGDTPFILAAYYGQTEALALLLKHHAEPCVVDQRGSNVYMGVAYKGYLPTAQWLLDHTQCDINQQNHAGQTALMMAALFGREEITALFLKHGADAAITDAQGNSAASLAAGQGLRNILDILKFTTR